MDIGRRVFGIVLAGGFLLVGCGGDTNANFTGPDGGKASDAAAGASDGSAGLPSTGSGGTSAGGSPGTGAGGASGGASASGGAASGGSGASGGAPGSGGAGGSSGCLPPVNKAQTAVCVTLVPEAITAQSDPGLDKKGALIIQIFDTPTPPQKNASSVALAERVVPANPGASEVSLDAIPTERIVGTFPDTAYVRAVFVDNGAVLAPGATLTWGAWVGGVNLSDGLKDNEPITPVKLAIGEGNSLSLPMVALRRLTVTVHASATPLGDGQGPLTAVVVNNPDATKKPPAFGLAQAACADVSKDVTLTGFVIGKGPYWITGALNDLGLGGDFAPGTMAALDVMGNSATIPQKLVIAPGDYSPTARIDLSYVVPLPADAGTVPPNSCADLVTDGGLPDGGP